MITFLHSIGWGLVTWGLSFLALLLLKFKKVTLQPVWFFTLLPAIAVFLLTL